MNTPPSHDAKTRGLPEAARFWERGRLLYNAILTAIVLLWLVLTWPHFRPSLTLGAFEALVVLALIANLCFSAAYIAEIFLETLLPSARWRRFRQALWLLGTLFAVVIENYWIADEIYPAASQPPPAFFEEGILVSNFLTISIRLPEKVSRTI